MKQLSIIIIISFKLNFILFMFSNNCFGGDGCQKEKCSKQCK